MNSNEFLINCPVCKNEISTYAITCPKCGEPRKTHIHFPSQGVAMVLSAVVPGLGQVYCGELQSGIFWFLGTLIGYLLLIPGIIAHIYCVIGAGETAQTTSKRRIRQS